MADNNGSWREEQEINTVINQGLFDYMSGCEDLGLLNKALLYYALCINIPQKYTIKRLQKSVQE